MLRAVVQRRWRWMVAVAVLALGALWTGQRHLPRSYGDDSAPAGRSSQPGSRVVPAVRGKILDRHGTPLADNRRAHNIYVTPRLFTSAIRTRLIDLLQLGADEVARVDRRVAGAGRAGRAILVLEDQGRKRARRVLRARRQLGGAIEVHRDSYRAYPHRALAGHLLGYLGRPSSRELPHHEASVLVGRYGLEKALERSLHGEEGSGGPRGERPVAGHDVVLTLDLELQKVAEQAVKPHAAAVAVTEVETGRILALVSTPSFDPNVMTGEVTRAEKERLENDPRRPLLDRTLGHHYPPASTFKLVTAVAGLESRLASPEEEMTCTGERAVGSRVLHDMEVHGTIDLLEALQRSCNIYFWTIGERVGIDRLAQVARDFGFGAPTGLRMNGDLSGQLPDRSQFGRDAGRNLVLTLNAAIGLGEVRVTVVQLAMAYAAVANGGRLYAPQVVHRIQTARGELVEERAPILRRAVKASPATLELIRRGMRRAVNARGGTAFTARKGVVKMVGKTGTELLRRPADEEATAHAWFAGWAPSDRPQIAVVVLIEHGGVGGAVAAPVARAIIDAYFTRSRARRKAR